MYSDCTVLVFLFGFGGVIVASKSVIETLSLRLKSARFWLELSLYYVYMMSFIWLYYGCYMVCVFDMFIVCPFDVISMSEIAYFLHSMSTG